jgi:hypothetical protein
MEVNNRSVISLYKSYVLLHLFTHSRHCDIALELSYCQCSTAHEYRRQFNMPEPNPDWSV